MDDQMARYTIIVSTMDFASINIRDKLFHIGLWERARGNDRFRVYRQGQFMLVETDDYHVFHDGIDRELEAMGYKPDAIIFASKHRSKDGRKTLTVHHTGNFGEARFGGRSHELATAAPRVALSLLKNLKFRATGYDISYEATHHGPSDLVTPSVYVEIGSSETEWKDAGAGEAVARAILDIKEDADAPVYLGIGGNHYAPRETALSLEAGTAFGHIIADHAIPLLTGETLAQAFERSGTRIAYIDRKSIPADERRRIEGLLASSGFEAHTESYIRDVALNPVLKCHRLRDLMVWRKLSRPQVSEKLRESAPRCGSGRCDACPIWAATEINGELLAFSYKLDRDSVLKIFSGAPVIYFLDNTGRPASLVVGMDRQSLDRATAWITERCVEILKTRHKIKYDPIEGMLYVIERRFDPGKARSLGVVTGPDFGRLSRGETVRVKGSDITPEMVFSESLTRIKLNNYSYYKGSGDGAMEPSIFNTTARTTRTLDNKGEIIDSDEVCSDIIDGEGQAVESTDVGVTDEDLMAMMKDMRTNVVVVGCGGGGSNSIARMSQEGITGAKLYAVNTDAQHLLHTHADKKFLIGKKLTRGFGAGSLPEIGENAAKESISEIKAALSRADMVFITCGLGGGTGTGSAPVVAQTARESSALTIAVVTTPFKAEGAIRKRNSDWGLQRLRESSDTVIVVPNDRLLEVVPDLPVQKAFRVADAVLTHAVKGITELVTKPGLVNLDFADIRTVMSNGGVAMIGLGEARGESRAIESVKAALDSPLLDVNIAGATAAIINVIGGEDMSISEAESVVEHVSNKIDPEARVIWGAHIEPELEDAIRTMVIITGVKSLQILGKETPVQQEIKSIRSTQKFGIDFIS